MPSLNRRVSDLLVVGVTSADIAPGAVTFADVGTIYTSNLTEDTNLFFSNTRATVAVAAGSAANALLFVNAAGVLSNTSSLVWTGSNLGVGTATPRLNTANVMAGLTTLTVYNVASEGGGIELATGSSTATAVAGRLTFTSGANNNGFRTIAWIDSLIQGSTAGNQGGSLRFGVKPDNGTAAIALTIDSAGNMGIGKTPVFKLDVSADASINGVRIGRGAGDVATNTAMGASALAANTSGANNTALGSSAGSGITTGIRNTVVGYSTLSATTTGNYNTAVGGAALAIATSDGNVAVGYRAQLNTTSGGANVAVGQDALLSNTTAANNTAVGYQAGYTNSIGTGLATFGYQAGYSTTADYNNFFGYRAGYVNTTGTANSAVGTSSLYYNTTGSYNTAIGNNALQANTTASNNTAVGYQAGYAATVGGYSTFVGYQSGLSSNFTSDAFANNTFIGALSGSTVTTGRKNTILGLYNGNQGGLDIRTASNYIVLSDGDGNPRFVVNSSGAISFGAANGSTDIASGAVGLALNANSGLQMLDSRSNDATNTYRYRFYNTNGLVGGILTNGSTTTYSTSSDYRLKENIQPMTGALAKVVALKPCTYTWKADGSAGEGFIAHELAEVCPYAVSGEKDAVEEDGSIKPQAIDTSFLVATLTAAIQELKADLDATKAELAALKGA